MDSLTQLALGTAVGGATAGRQVGRRALLWGAVCGTFPDLRMGLEPRYVFRFIVGRAANPPCPAGATARYQAFAYSTSSGGSSLPADSASHP